MDTYNIRKFKKLEYNIHKSSSFSPTYEPDNIKENKSNDQSSRWTSDSNNPPQYLTLKLQQPAIVESITFGKYEQPHVCNLKKFKILGGLEDTNMIELLEAGLKNDSISETFTLKHKIGSRMFPIKYVQIMPLLSWGSSFNFSIWFVELFGDSDPQTVEKALQDFNDYREKLIVRLCLKHFRQQNYIEPLRALEQQTGVHLEDPYISRLYNMLVEQSDFIGAETYIEQSVNAGRFDEYLTQQEYQANWQAVCPQTNEDLTFSSSESNGLSAIFSNSSMSSFSFESENRPGMRGGHQMCVDPFSEMIYLFGGWDGNQDLSDLWVYSVLTQMWTLLCRDSELRGGPTPRSCHKMCIDTKRKQIFTLGRYLDMQNRSSSTVKSDFYMYDIESEHWTKITSDTAAMGGPHLIYDHQMCIDIDKRILYVFGGRALTPPNDSSSIQGLEVADFSGLFSYEVSTNTWTRLLVDCNCYSQPEIPTIRSRVGHSMLFHSRTGKLYIFGGQRCKEYLNDFFTYNIETREITHEGVGADSPANIPPSGFTQRATIDTDLDEIYVLSGLSKEKEKRDENIQNSFWVYSIKEQKWRCVYRNENTGENYWKKMQNIEPCPRFAHQLVYDHIKKIHYLFGGNPGRIISPQLRLDDFWQLRLVKPNETQILQNCRLMIRKSNFKQLVLTDVMAALEYLQSTLSEVIDHSDPLQTKELQMLSWELFVNNSGNFKSMTEENDTVKDKAYKIRTKLFEDLMCFFPESVRQPKECLYDLLRL